MAVVEDVVDSAAEGDAKGDPETDACTDDVKDGVEVCGTESVACFDDERSEDCDPRGVAEGDKDKDACADDEAAGVAVAAADGDACCDGDSEAVGDGESAAVADCDGDCVRDADDTRLSVEPLVALDSDVEDKHSVTERDGDMEGDGDADRVNTPPARPATMLNVGLCVPTRVNTGVPVRAREGDPDLDRARVTSVKVGVDETDGREVRLDDTLTLTVAEPRRDANELFEGSDEGEPVTVSDAPIVTVSDGACDALAAADNELAADTEALRLLLAHAEPADDTDALQEDDAVGDTLDASDHDAAPLVDGARDRLATALSDAEDDIDAEALGEREGKGDPELN